MQLKGRKALVTGGSRGLGLGLVEALTAAGAQVTVVARGVDDLKRVREQHGAETIAADVTDADDALRIVKELRPDVLALIAGALPRVSTFDEISWDAFTATWETDVKAGLHWMQAALRAPMPPGSRVVVASSGAAIGGSPLSGGYAGAKRMLWLMANYANGISDEKSLNLKFQALVPLQMVADTGVGRAGAEGYARVRGVTPAEIFAGFGAPMPSRRFGDHVVSVLTDPQYAAGVAFGFRGDTGVTPLDPPA